MSIEQPFWDLKGFVAVIGSITGPISLFWNILRLRTRLRITSAYGQTVYRRSTQALDEKELGLISLTNKGERKVEIRDFTIQRCRVKAGLLGKCGLIPRRFRLEEYVSRVYLPQEMKGQFPMWLEPGQTIQVRFEIDKLEHDALIKGHLRVGVLDLLNTKWHFTWVRAGKRNKPTSLFSEEPS